MKTSEFFFRACGTGVVLLAFISIASCSFNGGRVSEEMIRILILLGVLTGILLAAGIIAAIWEK